MDLTRPLLNFEELRYTHQRMVEDYFETLVRISHVSEEQNTQTLAELRSLEGELRKAKGSLRGKRLLQVLSILLAWPLFFAGVGRGGTYLVLAVLAVALPVLVFRSTGPKVKELTDQGAALTAAPDSKVAEAAAQMACLNSLHTWGLAPALFQQVIPDVQFDRYMSEETRTRLYADFGLARTFTDGRSMLGVQSGSFRGNPFVFAKYRHHWVGNRNYQGSITIQWTEQEWNQDGTLQSVQRWQTLTATVVKPFPHYVTHTVLIYGHEAVPTLSFSRKPSRHSGLAEGAVNDWRKDRAVKSLERRARRAVAKGKSEFSVMANTEFEALFKAIDRNDEVGFRMLFTPLAQQTMLELLNDRTIGYGDDFSFTKQGMLNFIESKHLEATEITPDPRIFASLSVADARRSFRAFHAEYFKSVYFSLAPLWAVPMFHDSPSRTTKPSGEKTPPSSTWEHEVLANYIGEDRFKHPSSVTANILRATANHQPDGTSHVAINAFGYSGTPRVDIVTVLGGDGNYHQVPVHWTEYNPVTRRSAMLVGPIGNPELDTKWQAACRAQGANGPSFSRGALAAALIS